VIISAIFNPSFGTVFSYATQMMNPSADFAFIQPRAFDDGRLHAHHQKPEGRAQRQLLYENPARTINPSMLAVLMQRGR